MNEIPTDIDSRAIANSVLIEAWKRGNSVSNLKLQKLLFLCHAFYLVKNRGANLIRGSFEAWQYGPVHRVAYDAFRKHGDRPINEGVESINPITREKTKIPLPQNFMVMDVINDIVKSYGSWEPVKLVELTHRENSPWDYVVKSASNKANMGLKIRNDIIMERFKYLWFGVNGDLKGKKPHDEKTLVA